MNRKRRRGGGREKIIKNCFLNLCLFIFGFSIFSGHCQWPVTLHWWQEFGARIIFIWNVESSKTTELESCWQRMFCSVSGTIFVNENYTKLTWLHYISPEDLSRGKERESHPKWKWGSRGGMREKCFGTCVLCCVQCNTVCVYVVQLFWGCQHALYSQEEK